MKLETYTEIIEFMQRNGTRECVKAAAKLYSDVPTKTLGSIFSQDYQRKMKKCHHKFNNYKMREKLYQRYTWQFELLVILKDLHTRFFRFVFLSTWMPLTIASLLTSHRPVHVTVNWCWIVMYNIIIKMQLVLDRSSPKWLKHGKKWIFFSYILFYSSFNMFKIVLN